MDPACSGWYFNDEAILRRIEYLRTTCGLDMVGIKLAINLAREVDRLREELNFRRRRSVHGHGHRRIGSRDEVRNEVTRVTVIRE